MFAYCCSTGNQYMCMKYYNNLKITRESAIMSIQATDSMTSDSDGERAPLIDDHASRWTADARRNHMRPVISSDGDSISGRQPVQYGSINGNDSNNAILERSAAELDARAMLHRYRYYSRLDSRSDSTMLMPDHVAPSVFALNVSIDEAGHQSSLVTIFTICNTMVGTAVLSMPWAIRQAGFGLGILITVLFAAVTLYTAYRVMSSANVVNVPVLEFTDVCQYYMGRIGYYLSTVVSLTSILGGLIIYWILMSNFLYNVVKFTYTELDNIFDGNKSSLANNETSDVVCPQIHSSVPWTLIINPEESSKEDPPTNSTVPMFDYVWNKTLTVPFFLLILLGPILHFKSPIFFTKFTSLGTIAVLYLFTFIAIKAAFWGGINTDFADPTDIDFYVPEFRKGFPALCGILSLAFFIHSCIISIMKNQRQPENNTRDLMISFILVLISYLFVGCVFFLAFPLRKSCIADNLLDNFADGDLLAFLARLFLLFQLVTVFPLFAYVFRAQFLQTIFGRPYPGLRYVLLVNTGVVTVCLIFAIFLPEIGTIIRFSGSICACVYTFALPCVVYMCERHSKGLLTYPCVIIHVCIVLIGIANFVGQFLV